LIPIQYIPRTRTYSFGKGRKAIEVREGGEEKNEKNVERSLGSSKSTLSKSYGFKIGLEGEHVAMRIGGFYLPKPGFYNTERPGTGTVFKRDRKLVCGGYESNFCLAIGCSPNFGSKTL
jgi:hypothetical protein